MKGVVLVSYLTDTFCFIKYYLWKKMCLWAVLVPVIATHPSGKNLRSGSSLTKRSGAVLANYNADKTEMGHPTLNRPTTIQTRFIDQIKQIRENLAISQTHKAVSDVLPLHLYGEST